MSVTSGTSDKTENADAIVQKLAWNPPKGAIQDKLGHWRWGKGSVDEFGNRIGGNFIAGAPVPHCRQSPEKKRYMDLCKAFTTESLGTLIQMFYDHTTPDSVRLAIFKLLDERAWGRTPHAKEDREALTQVRQPLQLPIINTPQMLDDDEEFNDD